MLTALRRRLAADDGVSLVEMLVAVFVVGLVLAAMVSTTITSLAAASRDEQRVRVTAVANRALEELQSLPWDRTGLYPSDPGFVAQLEAGFPTVSLAMPGGVRDPLVPLPTETLAPPANGVPITLRRHVAWVDSPVDGVGINPAGCPPAGGYDTDCDIRDSKRLVVELSWTSRDRTQSMRVEGLRSPTPEERALSPFSHQLTQLAPSVVLLDADNRNLSPIQIQTVTSQPATSVTASYRVLDASNGTVTVTEFLTNTNAGRTWQSTIPAGARRWTNGEELFTFVATGTGGAQEVIAGRVLFVRDVALISVTSAPATLRIGAGGELCGDATLTATVEGVTASDFVSGTWMTSAYPTEAFEFFSPTLAGAVFTLVVPDGTVFPTSEVLRMEIRRSTPLQVVTVDVPTTFTMNTDADGQPLPC